jgi:hypothetical protein
LQVVLLLVWQLRLPSLRRQLRQHELQRWLLKPLLLRLLPLLLRCLQERLWLQLAAQQWARHLRRLGRRHLRQRRLEILLLLRLQLAVRRRCILIAAQPLPLGNCRPAIVAASSCQAAAQRLQMWRRRRLTFHFHVAGACRRSRQPATVQHSTGFLLHAGRRGQLCNGGCQQHGGFG